MLVLIARGVQCQGLVGDKGKVRFSDGQGDHKPEEKLNTETAGAGHSSVTFLDYF